MEEDMQGKRTPKRLHTTLAALAAACYDAAFAEFRNEKIAGKLAEHMVLDLLRSSRVRLAAT